MRILVITEEDEFYLPVAIDYLLSHCPYDITAVICARNPLLPGKWKAAKKFHEAFGFRPILQHAFRLLSAKIWERIPFLNRNGRHYSVQAVCQVHHMCYRHVDNVNTTEFIEYCRKKNIDLIACVSPTQIFREQLISTPKYGCINIHTAHLPHYRGLYPTFWAMAKGEKNIGVCVHYIEKGIDTGRILLRDQVQIPSKATMDSMIEKTKIKGVQLLLEAIDQIAHDRANTEYAQGEGSYYSFPTKDAYKEFRKLGYKLW